MRNSPVHELDFFNTTFNCRHRAVYFRDHPLADYAGLSQLRNFAHRQVPEEARVLFRISQQTRPVAHEHQATRLQCNRGLRGRDVGVAIVNLAVITKRCRTHYRRDAASNAFAQWLHIDVANFADESKIDISSILIFRSKLTAPKDIGASETARFPAEILDRLHNFRINFAREHTIDNFRAGGVGYAIAVHEFGFHTGFFQRACDRFATTMDDDRINSDRLEKNHVARD